MKRILLTVVLSTFTILGLFAQNSSFNLEPLSQYQKTKSERFDVLMKNGKPVELFDKVSQKRLTLTGDEIIQGKSQAKTKCSVSTKKSSKNDVATITLTVIGDPWGNGTGFQLLLDEDEIIVDNFWDWFLSGNMDQFYNHSEYKIPEDASSNLTNPKVILNGTGSVEIPGGVYDFVFFRPAPQDQMIWLCSWAETGEIAMADDYQFFAGFEYVFTIENQSNVVFAAPDDIKLSNIILPLSSLYLNNQEEVAVEIYNNGLENISGNIELAYKVNDGTEIVENSTVSLLLPGESILYTFNTKADFSNFGFYTVDARVEYEFDSNPYNNTISGSTKKMATIPLPFNDEFDTSDSKLNWSTIDGNGDGYSWMYDDWLITDADGGKGCLQVLCQTYGADEYLITDPIVISEAGTYNMSFYSYALGNDKITILYGKTYDVNEMEVLDVVYPNTSEWEIIEQLIEIEEPGNYFFAFYYFGVKSEGASGVDFDKFNFKLHSITNTYTITATASGCTQIFPPGNIVVKEGEDQTFTFSALLGCSNLKVLIDGDINDDALAALTYTFKNVTSNHTIEIYGELSIDEQEHSNVHLYPNPANNKVFIKNDTHLMQNIKMYDYTGRLLREWLSVQSSEMNIDISDYQSGIYFFDIDGITKKVVKQ
jgi:archaellum component FlaF (FlaF/FlaG flagellin family)